MTDIEKNTHAIIRFYNALVQGDVVTLEELGRPDYTQHNPFFETGLQDLTKAIRSRPPRAPDAPPVPLLRFVRIVAEDDLVMTLRRILPAPERDPSPEKEMAIIDIFRLQDGSLAEDWDYQERSTRANTPPRNQNGRF